MSERDNKTKVWVSKRRQRRDEYLDRTGRTDLKARPSWMQELNKRSGVRLKRNRTRDRDDE